MIWERDILTAISCLGEIVMASWFWQLRHLVVLAAFCLAVTTSWGGPVQAQRAEPTEITVFAAASLKNALDAAAADYEKATGNKVKIPMRLPRHLRNRLSWEQRQMSSFLPISIG